ncbi:MAG: AIPR family protein [Dactylosporangium sp.]|nr:AIPR family protein [Dactylosporangium sp.]NNJ60016.1 AIPR family protein [Dactylosporangium sp.]
MGQILGEFDLTIDEIRDGIVDGADDGGIDGVFTFLEGTLLVDDSDILDSEESEKVARKYPDGVELRLEIVQSKATDSFQQKAINNLIATLIAALDYTKDLDDLGDVLNEALRDRLGMFRVAHTALLTRRPRVMITVSIVTKGTVGGVAPNVEARASELEGQLRIKVPGALCSVKLVGADELWEYYQRRPPESFKLECREILTSGESHVALASISDFCKFIVDDRGAPRRHMFDANVRDYQGTVEVNNEIMNTLRSLDSPQFWWMNNGVTILCDHAEIVGKRFALRNPQIVNGLQSSHTIAKRFAEIDSSGAEYGRLAGHQILIRIVTTADSPVRDKIIRATNRQTPVPDASLRATDDIQRRIEEYFKASGYYYDRRKGYYRNLGKEPRKIIGIPYLGQAMFAVAYGRPDVARGKPNSLLKDEQRYKHAFDAGTDLSVFLWVAKFQRQIDELLQSGDVQARYAERRYLALFVSHGLIATRLGRVSKGWRDVKPVVDQLTEFSTEEVAGMTETVKKCLEEYRAETGSTPERSTKTQAFTTYLNSYVL